MSRPEHGQVYYHGEAHESKQKEAMESAPNTNTPCYREVLRRALARLDLARRLVKKIVCALDGSERKER